MGISEPSYQNAAALNMNNNINNNNVNEDENSAKRSSTITNNNNDSLEQINVKTDSTPATIITTNIIPTAPATPTPAGTDQKLNINNSNNNISKNNIINNNNNNAIISNNHTKTNNNNNSNNNMEELLYDIPVGEYKVLKMPPYARLESLFSIDCLFIAIARLFLFEVHIN